MSAAGRHEPPNLRPAPDGSRGCWSCQHWSQWLPTLGCCMGYAHARGAAMATDTAPDFRDRWPIKSAAQTARADLCDDWSAK